MMKMENEKDIKEMKLRKIESIFILILFLIRDGGSQKDLSKRYFEGYQGSWRDHSSQKGFRKKQEKIIEGSYSKTQRCIGIEKVLL